MYHEMYDGTLVQSGGLAGRRFESRPGRRESRGWGAGASNHGESEGIAPPPQQHAHLQRLGGGRAWTMVSRWDDSDERKVHATTMG